MSHTPNELADLFPDDAETLHRLKAADAHFAQRADEYHVLNRTVHRIEAGVEAASDARTELLKKQRLELLDYVAAGIAAARAAHAA